MKKLSVDLPSPYYEALDKVARSPGMTHRLAVYAIAGAEEVFPAGFSSSRYHMSHDSDYHALRDHPEAADGYTPNLTLSFESIVQLGHTGCLIIYEDSELKISEIRRRVDEILTSEHRQAS